MADRIIYRLWEPPVRGVTHTQRVMVDVSPDTSPELVRRSIARRSTSRRSSAMSEALTAAALAAPPAAAAPPPPPAAVAAAAAAAAASAPAGASEPVARAPLLN